MDKFGDARIESVLQRFLFIDIVSFPDPIGRFLKSSSLSITGLTSIRNILFFTKQDCPTKLSLT